jgi:hypothetical protein
VPKKGFTFPMKTLPSFFCTATDTPAIQKQWSERQEKNKQVFFFFLLFWREVINSEQGTIKSRRRKQVTYYYYADDDEYIGEDRFIGHGINPSFYLTHSILFSWIISYFISILIYKYNLSNLL